MESYFKSIVYGGTDGIITIFNIISGINGAQLNANTAVIICLSVIISDAISMGFSDYSSTRTDKILGYTKNNEIKSGLITFLSFIIFGLLPLTIFIFLIYINKKNAFIYSLISVIISLFILGVLKSKFNKEHYLVSGLRTSFYGLLASIISYLTGKHLSKIFK